MSDIFNLIPVVNAQELDTIAQPTFGVIDIGTQGGSLATVLLNSSSTAVKVGDRFKVTIEVKTNEQSINEYKILVDYDATKLSVVDQDSNTPGTQITFLDTVFSVSDPANDNIASSTGRITLLASTPSGNGFSVNRNVAEIEFQAQQIGAPTIKIVQGAVGTQLLRTNGTALSFTPNEVAVQISSIEVTPTPEPPVNEEPGNTGGNVDIPEVIPNTGITDALSLLPYALGITLILIGVGLMKQNPKKIKK